MTAARKRARARALPFGEPPGLRSPPLSIPMPASTPQATEASATAPRATGPIRAPPLSRSSVPSRTNGSSVKWTSCKPAAARSVGLRSEQPLAREKRTERAGECGGELRAMAAAGGSGVTLAKPGEQDARTGEAGALHLVGGGSNGSHSGRPLICDTARGCVTRAAFQTRCTNRIIWPQFITRWLREALDEASLDQGTRTLLHPTPTSEYYSFRFLPLTFDTAAGCHRQTVSGETERARAVSCQLTAVHLLPRPVA